MAVMQCPRDESQLHNHYSDDPRDGVMTLFCDYGHHWHLEVNGPEGTDHWSLTQIEPLGPLERKLGVLGY